MFAHSNHRSLLVAAKAAVERVDEMLAHLAQMPGEKEKETAAWLEEVVEAAYYVYSTPKVERPSPKKRRCFPKKSPAAVEWSRLEEYFDTLQRCETAIRNALPYDGGLTGIHDTAKTSKDGPETTMITPWAV